MTTEIWLILLMVVAALSALAGLEIGLRAMTLSFRPLTPDEPKV